jgi:type II secretory pathway component GspD/PulD (secretin)
MNDVTDTLHGLRRSVMLKRAQTLSVPSVQDEVRYRNFIAQGKTLHAEHLKQTVAKKAVHAYNNEKKHVAVMTRSELLAYDRALDDSDAAARTAVLAAVPLRLKLQHPEVYTEQALKSALVSHDTQSLGYLYADSRQRHRELAAQGRTSEAAHAKRLTQDSMRSAQRSFNALIAKMDRPTLNEYSRLIAAGDTERRCGLEESVLLAPSQAHPAHRPTAAAVER